MNPIDRNFNLTTMEYVMLRLLELDGVIRTEKATDFQRPLLGSLVEKGFAVLCPEGWRKAQCQKKGINHEQ